MSEKKGQNPAFAAAYVALTKILREGAYAHLAVQDIPEESRAAATRIVRGVLEKQYELSYILNKLTQKQPRAAVKTVLYIGLYVLRYMEIPAYAAVNECVALTESVGKRQVKGYVNAILNRAAREEYTLPKEGEAGYEEVQYNLPSWMIRMLKEAYPDTYHAMLLASTPKYPHIRLSPRLPRTAFEKECPAAVKTETGYFAENTERVKELFRKGYLTYQSYTSTLAVEAMGEVRGKQLLDVCSAPGGKSVYLAEKGADVTACDIYPHRVKLIEAYAKRMEVPLKTVTADALHFCAAWENKFDGVLADVPCSGLGVIAKRRDMAWNREEDDIDRLVSLQFRILENVCRYVKPGGVLLYATCTVLPAENEENVRRFLKTHPAFRLEEEKQYMQDGKGTDGFYYARMRKEEG